MVAAYRRTVARTLQADAGAPTARVPLVRRVLALLGSASSVMWWGGLRGSGDARELSGRSE